MQLTNRVFVLLVLLRQWAQFHVFVDMFPCKTKMFIWGTSQRIVPAVAVQLTNSHLLCPALFFLFGLFSTVGAPSWIGTSCLVYLLCCLVYDRGIFPAVYWAMWKHGWTGSSWDFGSDSQMLLIYFSLLRCHCFQFSTVWSRQNDLCNYLLGCISCQTDSFSFATGYLDCKDSSCLELMLRMRRNMNMLTSPLGTTDWLSYTWCNTASGNSKSVLTREEGFCY